MVLPHQSLLGSVGLNHWVFSEQILKSKEVLIWCYPTQSLFGSVGFVPPRWFSKPILDRDVPMVLPQTSLT